MRAPDPAADRLPLFVYGTLRDDAVLAVVLGGPASRLSPREARLHDHRCVRVPGRHYPRLRRSPGEVVAGRLLTSLRPAHWRRLAYFEGDGYRLRRARVVSGRRVLSAWYCDHVGPGSGGAPWDFGAWQRSRRSAFLRGARRAMRRYSG